MRQPTSMSTRAALLMLASVAAFSMMDAGLKTLSASYPAFEVACLRGAASLPFVLAWALSGALAVTMMSAFVFALQTLPLSTAYSIFFVAPLLVTALSVPVLGERVGPRRWAAIAVGLIGVLVVLRPTGAGLGTLASLAVLLAASMYAIGAVSVRLLSRTDTTQSMMISMLALLAAGAGLLALPHWVALRVEHLPLILGVGLAGAIGQYAITEAFRRGEASMIAPLEYTALVWGVLLDVALWHVLPDAVTWIGTAIIVGSGLYLLRRERVRALPTQVVIPP